MNVVEYFKTIQGEGKFMGVPSLFIRTMGCNLRCAWKNEDGSITKCDTPYTSWENTEKTMKLDANDILELAEESNLEHIVITGGEPMLQKDIEEVVDKLYSIKKYIPGSSIGEMDNKYHITIETNGTIEKHLKGAFMSFSPKFPSSNALNSPLFERNNHYIEPIRNMIKTNDYQLKFVINTQEDLNLVKQIQKDLNIPSEKIYLMPQGISNKQFKEKEKWIVNECLKNKYNYAPRLHILIWGNKRGV